MKLFQISSYHEGINTLLIGIGQVRFFAFSALFGVVLLSFSLAGECLAADNGLGWQAVVEMSREQQSRVRTEMMKSQGAEKGQPAVDVQIQDNRLHLSGTEGVDQLRQALFDNFSGSINPLGGPVELTVEVPAFSDMAMTLEARSTTGYIWEVVGDRGTNYRQEGRSTFSPRHRGIGAPTTQTVHIHSNAAAKSTVKLVYRRPFQRNLPIRSRVNIALSTPVKTFDLTDPTPSVINVPEIPFNQEKGAVYPEPMKGLPTSWDWRTQQPNIVPEVRDQGGCGSCWAFGTVGVMESALVQGGGAMTDLSEQFLVSCNKDGWNCDGGLTANKYHFDAIGLNQTSAGAVLESVKLYTETNGTCEAAYDHPYKLNSWKFISGNEWTMPTNDQLKSAIYTYGPITAGVCVDDGWYYYTGGVYAPTMNACGGGTNHQIILVGWDDASQSWILRNSWGTSFGENGYMRIKYDPDGLTSRIGEGTSWVLYQNTSQKPILAPIYLLLLEN